MDDIGKTETKNTHGIQSVKGTVRDESQVHGEASHAFSEGKEINMFTREPDLATVNFVKTLDFKKDTDLKRKDNNSKMSDSVVKSSAMLNIMFNK